ncbi:MAG: N-acetylglutaminylglutamine synthetase [Acidimicrobiales bacterium]
MTTPDDADPPPDDQAAPGAPPARPARDGRADRADRARGARSRRAPGWDRDDAITTTTWERPPEHLVRDMARRCVIDMGWGRLMFGQTFPDHASIEEALGDEQLGRRDIALYVTDPHVLVSRRPQELFIDPSYTFRRQLTTYRARRQTVPGVVVRNLNSAADAEAVNRIYVRCSMVPAPAGVLLANQRERHVSILVAVDDSTGTVVGTVTGLDHERLFADPEAGSSLWCLAVDPDCSRPGVGEALTRTLAEKFLARGRAYIDLSVMHDNRPAIRLYEKLGFERVPVFAVKRKNAINEQLFAGAIPDDLEHCNPYARIVADEALRRGIRVEVLDAEGGFLKLSHGGRSVVTRESLSALTTAVAMSRCDDKRVTRKLVAAAGLAVPAGRSASHDDADHDFLAEVGDIVVKPARGEQGRGITVGVTDHDHLDEAIALARSFCPDVLLEQRCDGDDLRLVVIANDVVAAAVRRPATVVGTGRHTVGELIAAQSRRRSAATGGESSIPLDDGTVRTLEDAGLTLESVLEAGRALRVRRTANLHTGGTIHDVTDTLHPTLADAAVRASRAIEIPVTGIDLLVPDATGPDYVFIEANERPGLANHEPQPTAERFIDFLFPTTSSLPWGWTATAPGDRGAANWPDTHGVEPVQ